MTRNINKADIYKEFIKKDIAMIDIYRRYLRNLVSYKEKARWEFTARFNGAKEYRTRAIYKKLDYEGQIKIVEMIMKRLEDKKCT